MLSMLNCTIIIEHKCYFVNPKLQIFLFLQFPGTERNISMKKIFSIDKKTIDIHLYIW